MAKSQIVIEFKPSLKQSQALRYLRDNTTDFVGYGGAAFSGKSYLLAYWLTINCVGYPGTGWGLGRRELTVLKKTTLLTLFKVFKECNVQPDIDYTFNQQQNVIEFTNGSTIFLIDTEYKPSDPLFERFGGLELTGCAVDESAETDPGAIEILSTRIGRRLNEKYKLRAKFLETFNPSKKHVYSRYYKPFRDGCETIETRFIKALPTDNPSPEVTAYVDRILNNASKITIERLIKGNFEYDDDPACLVEYDAITDLFTNDHVKPEGKKYLSADLAMKGRDKFIVSVWHGLVCELKVEKDYSTGKEIEGDVKNMMVKHSVPHSQTIVDSDGLGSYLESYLKGIKEFHGGGKAKSDEYANMKSECGYKLAELINKRLIKIVCNETQKKYICEELEMLKAADVDADEKKKRIIKKDDMKSILGRSPDYLDTLLMRMYFEITPTPTMAKGRAT